MKFFILESGCNSCFQQHKNQLIVYRGEKRGVSYFIALNQEKLQNEAVKPEKITPNAAYDEIIIRKFA